MDSYARQLAYSDWFPVKITGGDGSAGYTGVEVRNPVGGPDPEVIEGGRELTTANPGFPLTAGLTFAVDEVCLCRQGPGSAGTEWELVKADSPPSGDCGGCQECVEYDDAGRVIGVMKRNSAGALVPMADCDQTPGPNPNPTPPPGTSGCHCPFDAPNPVSTLCAAVAGAYATGFDPTVFDPTTFADKNQSHTGGYHSTVTDGCEWFKENSASVGAPIVVVPATPMSGLQGPSVTYNLSYDCETDRWKLQVLVFGSPVPWPPNAYSLAADTSPAFSDGPDLHAPGNGGTFPAIFGPAESTPFTFYGTTVGWAGLTIGPGACGGSDTEPELSNRPPGPCPGASTPVFSLVGSLGGFDVSALLTYDPGSGAWVGVGGGSEVYNLRVVGGVPTLVVFGAPGGNGVFVPAPGVGFSCNAGRPALFFDTGSGELALGV